MNTVQLVVRIFLVQRGNADALLQHFIPQVAKFRLAAGHVRIDLGNVSSQWLESITLKMHWPFIGIIRLKKERSAQPRSVTNR